MTHEILLPASAASIAAPAFAALYVRRGTWAADVATTVGIVAVIAVALCLIADLLAPAPIEGASLVQVEAADIALVGAGVASNLVALATLALAMAGVIPRVLDRRRLGAAWILLELPFGLCVLFSSVGAAVAAGLFPALTLGLMTLAARRHAHTREGRA